MDDNKNTITDKQVIEILNDKVIANFQESGLLSLYFKGIADFIKLCMVTYKNNKEIDKEMLKCLLDLEHDLEIPEAMSYHEIARMGKKIRELRRNRRPYKNEYLLYEPIVKFMESHKLTDKDLYDLVDKIKDVEIHLAEKHYNRRSKVEEVYELSKYEDDKNDPKLNLIKLNTILSKYSLKYNSTSKKNKSNGYDYDFSIHFDVVSKVSSLRKKLILIKDEIANQYGINYEDKSIQLNVSDYLSNDQNGISKLECVITITNTSEKNTSITTITGRAYGCESSNSKVSKKKKRKRR